jgi:hypothetical protein
VEVVGEVAVEREGLGGRRWEDRLRQPVAGLVAHQRQRHRGLGVVALLPDVAAGADPLGDERPVVAGDRARRALHPELRRPDGGDVGLEELRLPPVGPRHPDPQLVEVGHVVPHPLVGRGRHRRRGRAEELEDPVDVVRPPVVDGTAGHWCPPSARRRTGARSRRRTFRR